jgi:hypothetical protein
MTIFGKPLSQYVAFCRAFLVLIPLAGLVRLALSLSGTPNSSTRWISMNALLFIAVLYLSVRIHTSGFGRYRHLLVVCALLNISAQIVSVLGILIAIATNTDNVFTAPEYSFDNGRSWFHVAMHLLVGTTAGSLVPWLVGSIVLAITRKVATPSRLHA